MASSESKLGKFTPRRHLDKDGNEVKTGKGGGRFAGLARSADRIKTGYASPHPEEPLATREEVEAAIAEERESQANVAAVGKSLKDKLGGKKKPQAATIRMSVEMPVEMSDQINVIAQRNGIPRAQVVREILAEVLPDLV